MLCQPLVVTQVLLDGCIKHFLLQPSESREQTRVAEVVAAALTPISLGRFVREEKPMFVFQFATATNPENLQQNDPNSRALI